MTANRCTGHCCRKFALPFSPKELRAAYDRWLASQEGYTITKCGLQPADAKLYQDIHLVAPMVEYLGRFDYRTFTGVNPSDDELRGERYKCHYYRCRLFDEKAKKCTIYEIRPKMCREYPYGKKCNYTGCTWQKVKAKKETRAERAERKRRLLEEKRKAKAPGGKRT